MLNEISATDRAAAQIWASDAQFAPMASGHTIQRFRALAAATRSDIAVGRLIEAHLDATAILADLAGPQPTVNQLWGVWAAEVPGLGVRATERAGRWTLTGTKGWCSGAIGCTHALVTAYLTDGAGGTTSSDRRLFAVDLSSGATAAGESQWVNPGMARTETRSVHFSDTPATTVGEVGSYFERAGFWHGAVSVAACWLGGAFAVADLLYDATGQLHEPDDLRLTQLGEVEALLLSAWSAIAVAADDFDRCPNNIRDAHAAALRVRWLVERTATAVIDRVGRALGPAPLVSNQRHAQRVADLTVYIRQSHADYDLKALGAIVAAGRTDPLTGA